MCGIAGFCNPNINYLENEQKWKHTLNNMNNIQKHRGPDEQNTFITNGCAFAHARLSIIDLKNGSQPMTRCFNNKKYTIVYNGEIYNSQELRDDLEKNDAIFSTTSDTEIILFGHLIYGQDFVKKLNGIFAYAIWDENNKTIFLYRDHIGIKPLFYTFNGNNLVFSSEIKGLLQHPQVEAKLDYKGLCEIFGLGPAKTCGNGVFKNIFEVLPGHFIKMSKSEFYQTEYWKLKSKPHTDTFEETVEKTSFLIHDSIKRQMISDIPICTFLSGGVDSSIVTAICAKELNAVGSQLNTFSFDFKYNDIFFKSNSFQPSQDRPWVDIMINHSNTNHTYLECNTNDLVSNLFNAVDARDLPCMADVESSLLYFCSKVALKNKVALTGECADEIFGGYPWFYNQEMFNATTFPWSMDISHRKILLSDQTINNLPLDEYIQSAYESTISSTPKLHGESAQEARRREMAYLNIKWFMQNLLDRLDRTSMHSGLEARVPFADHRIIEYIWNVPWNMKCNNGIIKGLLRKASEQYLPKQVLYRKKSPYPKTYNPAYEKALKNMVMDMISNNNSPILNFISKSKVKKFIKTPSNYTKPWYGQLMAGPQMLAYILQINYWLQKYKIYII